MFLCVYTLCAHSASEAFFAIILNMSIQFNTELQKFKPFQTRTRCFANLNHLLGAKKFSYNLLFTIFFPFALLNIFVCGMPRLPTFWFMSPLLLEDLGSQESYQVVYMSPPPPTRRPRVPGEIPGSGHFPPPTWIPWDPGELPGSVHVPPSY